jgi:hypothetical protein
MRIIAGRMNRMEQVVVGRINLTLEGHEGQQEMNHLCCHLRRNPPHTTEEKICEGKVVLRAC